MESLKRQFLELLDRDVEFRYTVAGYLGLSEILKRLDALAEEQTRLAEEQTKLAEEQTKIWGEIAKIWGEIKALKEEQVKLREDMIAGFKRHDEEIAKLREDMSNGFRVLSRHIDALGARWGIISEQAFREGLRGLLERDFGFRVERWVKRDEQGFVYGHPSDVDIDVAVHDGKVILVEVRSHVEREDVYYFRRRCEFYRAMEGREPTRLIIVTPYADEDALRIAEQLGIEVYTKV